MAKQRWPILAALIRFFDGDCGDDTAEKIIKEYVDNKIHVAEPTSDDDCEDEKEMEKIDKTGCTVKKLCRYYESKEGSPPKTAKELLLYAIENNINIKLGKMKVITKRDDNMDFWESLNPSVTSENTETIEWSVASKSGSMSMTNSYNSETGIITVNSSSERTSIITTMVAAVATGNQ